MKPRKSKVREFLMAPLFRADQLADRFDMEVPSWLRQVLFDNLIRNYRT